MNVFHKICFVAFCLLVLCCIQLWGEEALRTDSFFWDEISSEHFRVIHPSGMVKKAQEAALYLEEGLARIVDDLDVEIKREIPVILFRSSNEFEQNTVLGGPVPESLQAFAETFKNRIVLPVYSSQRYFKYVIQHELTHIVEFESLFPRRLPSFYIIRFPFYPDWFTEGLSEYESDFNSTYRNMLIRDVVLDGRVKPMYKLFGFSHLNRHEVAPAYKQGGEFIRYLSILNSAFPRKLLHTFRDHMPWNISSVVRKACGIEYRTLDADFRKYLQEKAQSEIKGRSELQPESVIVSSQEFYYSVFNTDAVWSPDGKRIAFISDRADKTTIFIVNSDGTEITPLLKLRVNFSIEHIHRGKGGNLTWSPDGGRLAFVGEWKNRDYLYVLDMADEQLKRFNPGFDSLRDPSFSPDGMKLVFSGIKNGVSDIFVFDPASETSKRITDDPFDDFAPSFNSNGWAILYTSERKGQTDLILVDSGAENPKISEQILTPLLSDESVSGWNASGDKIVFVSNREAFSDIYIMDTFKKTLFKQTSLVGGAFQPRFSPDSERILFSYYRHGSYSIAVVPVNVSDEAKVELTVAQNVLDDLSKYTEGSKSDLRSKPFNDSHSWHSLFPLGVVNWGSFSNMFSDSRIDGAIFPYFTEDGAFFSGEILYWNMMTRFDFGAGIIAESEFDYDTDIRTDDLSAVIQLKYPFDAYRSLAGGIVVGRETEYSGSTVLSEKDRAGVFVLVAHDNQLYRGLHPIRGQRVAFTAEMYPGGGDDLEEYSEFSGEIFHSFSFWDDTVLKLNLRGILSTGPDRQVIDIADVIRGYETEIAEGNKLVSAGAEFVFPLSRDMNWSLVGHYLLLKDVRGFAFFEGGAVSNLAFNDFIDDFTAGNLEFRHSVGAGVQIDLYGMQKALFGIRIGIAAVTDKYDDRISAFLDLQILF